MTKKIFLILAVAGMSCSLHESGCTTCDKGHCTAGVVHGCRTDAPAFGADLP